MDQKPPIKVTFLGTGTSQGVPVITCPCPVCHSEDGKDKRLRSSILLESPTTTVIIDTGPDFRYQMLRENIKKLDAVVFTHEHKDHIAGLDDIRAFNFRQNGKVPLYCVPRVEDCLRREFSYAFAEVKYPGVPEIEIHTIDAVHPFRIGDIDFQPILVYHHKMPVLGFRINDFTYITDANQIPEAEIGKIRGSSVVVLNALRMDPHISHFSLREAIDMIGILGPETAYFTHISHLLGKHGEVEPTLPGNMHLAFDRLSIMI